MKDFMLPEKWQKLQELFEAALEHDPDARPSFLEQACGGDDLLRRRVESLLHSFEQDRSFLETPAVAEATDALRETIETALTPSPLSPALGSRMGPYEILSQIGAGGMGKVYRAHDSRLNRDVAVKVSTERFDARFKREAQAIAALNHPYICTLHDIGPNYLVLELVEGPTLGERIENGPIPLTEALGIARQIGEALEAAHDKGIVHRDLKPANIKITPDGHVKVLDFGLAKTGVVPGRRAEDSPSRETNLTETGIIMGTAPYMPPEQARGATIDKRADIWAFGVVLYEMLTGQRPFQGKSVSDVLAAVLKEEPDFSHVPAETQKLLRRCLEKDPRRRLRDIGDVWQLLEKRPERPKAKAQNRRTFAVAAISALASAAVSAAWWGRRPTGTLPQTEVRLDVAPPPGTEFFSQNVENVPLAISPDGETLAFVAVAPGNVLRIWIRRVSEFESRPLAGTEGATSIIWSPNGKSIGFFGSGKLQRLDLPSGAPVTICDVGQGGYGGSWGEEDEILFAPIAAQAIYRVDARGGTAEKILELDAARNEVRVSWPRILPGGRGFLYLSRDSEAKTALMWVQPGKSPRVMAPLASRFEIIEPDMLVFVRDGALLVQRVDLVAGRLVGAPSPVAPSVNYFATTGWAGFAVSPRGNLFYLSKETSRRLLWLNRSGQPDGEAGEHSDYYRLSLSPDGGRIATSKRSGAFDLWLLDLARNAETKLVSSPDADISASWLPDGTGIVYSGVRRRGMQVIRRSLATGTEEILLPSDGFQESTDISRDGRQLAYIERGKDGRFHAWTLQLEGERRPKMLFKADSDQDYVRFSRDGNFVAYTSDESGQREAYVASLANPNMQVPLSRNGATLLRWRRDGREILFLTPAQEMMGVSVIQTSPKLELGLPEKLFTIPEGKRWSDFEVTADGQRFLGIELVQSGGAQPASAILHWSPPR